MSPAVSAVKSIAAIAGSASAAPATMNVPSKLMALPAELHCAIASAADNDVVLALRLTCRELSAACLDTFCSRFFTCRRHLHVRAGLQQLVDITSQPHLRTKLEQIQLIPVEFHVNRHFPNQFSLIPLKDIWDTEQDDFVDSGAECTLLVQLLDNLAACKSKPEIRITELRSDNVASDYAGFPSIEKLLGKTNARNRIRKASSARFLVQALTSASAKATSPMTKLDIGHVRRLFDDDGLFDLPESTLQKAWSKLTQLVLGSWESDPDWRSPSLSGLSKLLQSTTNLRHLRMNAVGPSDGDGSKMLKSKLNTSGLRIISLCCLEFNFDELENFFANQVGTLRFVGLMSVRLRSKEHWQNVFRCLAGGKRLASLLLGSIQISGLIQSTMFMIKSAMEPEQRIEVTGAENVHKTLIELAETVKFVESDEEEEEDEDEEGEDEEDEEEAAGDGSASLFLGDDD